MDDFASSSHETNNKWWIYDVFLSFRGEDTRRNFTDHLYHALTDAGIYTFRDDIDLPRGEGINPELLSAIHKSRICIVVFSRNYADSKWCLEELAEIVSCRRALPQLLLPVFYDVDPAEVRKQLNSFGEAFTKHEEDFAADRDKVDKWRKALTEAGSISGWDSRNFADGHEGKFIREIVRHIANELKPRHLNVATYPVGIEVRLRKLSLWMSVGPNDCTRILGICGMGGSGKTTLSKAIFNQYSNSFEGESFIANVRENSNSLGGLTQLQKQLLSDVLNTGKMTEINNVDVGINMIKERLCRKRILLILDDVDSMDQVSAIARKRDWFGLGSRIIITTRDKQLLEALKVDEVYMAEDDLLDENESLELFSWHAFQEPFPPPEFFDYSKDVVSYCRSLPLALEVLGSFLSGRSILEWKNAIEKLKRIPQGDINKKLKISYDALGDYTEKNIFLDVCCFFVGMEKDLVVNILDGCGFYGEIGLNVLISKCLVKIIRRNYVTRSKEILMVHDLLCDMGRDIVREVSLNEPGKHTRLWLQEEAYDVLRNNTGTEKIEGLVLELPEGNKQKLYTKAFGKMRNLRLLKLNYVHLIGNFNHLISKELRWICWHGFPLKVIPSNLYLGNLVVIDMRKSKLKEAWKGKPFLGNLKILNLSSSYMLTKSPDFSNAVNLEELKLMDCTSLSEMHQSIGQLQKLHLLDLFGCRNLTRFPSIICKLNSLQTLRIENCLKIDRLPEELGEVKSLTTLIACKTAIRQIPHSIGQLDKLEYLSLDSVKWGKQGNSKFFALLRKNSNPLNFLPTSLHGLTSLRKLSLRDCAITDNDIPVNIGSLSSLEELDLSRNGFQHFRASISGLSNLVRLNFSWCKRLESVPELPKKLKYFFASECTALEKIPDLSTLTKPLQRMDLQNCRKLFEVPGLMVGGDFNFQGCSNLSSTFTMSLVQKWIEADFGSICIPRSDIPECFNFISSEPTLLCLQVPKVSHRILRLDVCFAYSRGAHRPQFSVMELTNRSRGHSWNLKYENINSFLITGDSICLTRAKGFSPLPLDAGDDVECLIKAPFSPKNFGVRLVYDNHDAKYTMVI